MGNFPNSNPARVGLGVVVALFWLLGFPTGIAAVPGLPSALTLVALGMFGPWGLAAIVLGYALAGTHTYEDTSAFGLRLLLTAVRLGIVLIVIRRLILPASPARLKSKIPLIVAAALVVNWGFTSVYFLINGHSAWIPSTINVSLLISAAVQIVIGYLIVLPAYRWLDRRGGLDALGGLATRGVQAAKTGIARQREEAVANTERLKEDVRLRGEQAELEKPQEIEIPKQKKSDFAVAKYDVPHCHFQKTEEGFIVTFNKTGKFVHRALNHSHQQKNAGLGAAVGNLVMLAGVGAVALAQKAGEGTRIEVTQDAVIIDGKKMSRDDFGNFHVSSTYKGAHQEGAVASLGYQFGSQSFEFGGTWDERQANEVAASLNHHLRRTPKAGEENRASPNSLRSARPTEF